MKILVAEDEPVTRCKLEALLIRSNYNVVSCESGDEAWETLQRPDSPELLLLDWQMPGLTGYEICRRARAELKTRSLYILILTAAMLEKEDSVAALEAGADDFLSKPFDPANLRARLGVGWRVLKLQRELRERIHELEDALAQIKTLQGLIPICGWCKKIRHDKNYWQEVDHYITAHTGVRFTHGICPSCMEKQRGALL